MRDQFAGSKRKARQQAREREQAAEFQADLAQLAELAQHIESEAQLDAFLEQIEDVDVRAEVRKLILAVRKPLVEIATGPEDIRRAVSSPSGNRSLVIPTAAGPLVLES